MRTSRVSVFFYGLFMDESLLGLATKLELPDSYLSQIRNAI